MDLSFWIPAPISRHLNLSKRLKLLKNYKNKYETNDVFLLMKEYFLDKCPLIEICNAWYYLCICGIFKIPFPSCHLLKCSHKQLLCLKKYSVIATDCELIYKLTFPTFNSLVVISSILFETSEYFNSKLFLHSLQAFKFAKPSYILRIDTENFLKPFKKIGLAQLVNNITFFECESSLVSISRTNLDLALLILFLYNVDSFIIQYLEKYLDLFVSQSEYLYILLKYRKYTSNLFKSDLLKAITEENEQALRMFAKSDSMLVSKYASKNLIVLGFYDFDYDPVNKFVIWEIILSTIDPLYKKSLLQKCILSPDALGLGVAFFTGKLKSYDLLTNYNLEVPFEYQELFTSILILPLLSKCNQIVQYSLIDKIISFLYNLLSKPAYKHILPKLSTIDDRYKHLFLEKIQPESSCLLKYLGELSYLGDNSLKTITSLKGVVSVKLNDQIFDKLSSLSHFESLSILPKLMFSDCLNLNHKILKTLEQAIEKDKSKHKNIKNAKPYSLTYETLKSVLFTWHFMILKHQQFYANFLWEIMSKKDILSDIIIENLVFINFNSKLFLYYIYRVVYMDDISFITNVTSYILKNADGDFCDFYYPALLKLITYILELQIFNEDVLKMFSAISSFLKIIYNDSVVTFARKGLFSADPFIRTCILTLYHKRPILNDLMSSLFYVYSLYDKNVSYDVVPCKLEHIFETFCDFNVSEEFADAFSDALLQISIKFKIGWETDLLKKLYFKLYEGRGKSSKCSVKKRIALIKLIQNLPFDLIPSKKDIFSMLITDFIWDSNEEVRAATFSTACSFVDSNSGEVIKYILNKQNDDKEICTYLYSLLSKSVTSLSERIEISSKYLIPFLINSTSEVSRKTIYNSILSLNIPSSKTLFQEHLSLCSTSKSYKLRGYAYCCFVYAEFSDIFDHIITATENEYQKIHFITILELSIAKFGKKMENIATKIFPVLLKLLGDSSSDMRATVQSCINNFFEFSLTPIGTRLIVPVLVCELYDNPDFLSPSFFSFQSSRKTKETVCKILQVVFSKLTDASASFCLQNTIEALVYTLSATPFEEVQIQSRKALIEITKCLKNPEIRSIAYVIVDAISDKTSISKLISSLTSIFSLTFAHVFDSSSYVFLISFLAKCLQINNMTEKNISSSKIKQMTCYIIGSVIRKLVDPSIVMTHSQILFKALKTASLENSFDVRRNVSLVFGCIFKHVVNLPKKPLFNDYNELFMNINLILPTLILDFNSDNHNLAESSSQILAYIFSVFDPEYTKMFLNENSNLSYNIISFLGHLIFAFECNQPYCGDLYNVNKIHLLIPKILYIASKNEDKDTTDLCMKLCRLMTVRHIKLIGYEEVFDTLLSTIYKNEFSIELLSLLVTCLNDVLSSNIPDRKRPLAIKYLIDQGLSRHTLLRVYSFFSLIKFEVAEEENWVSIVRSLSNIIIRNFFSNFNDHFSKSQLLNYIFKELLNSVIIRRKTCSAFLEDFGRSNHEAFDLWISSIDDQLNVEFNIKSISLLELLIDYIGHSNTRRSILSENSLNLICQIITHGFNNDGNSNLFTKLLIKLHSSYPDYEPINLLICKIKLSSIITEDNSHKISEKLLLSVNITREIIEATSIDLLHKNFRYLIQKCFDSDLCTVLLEKCCFLSFNDNTFQSLIEYLKETDIPRKKNIFTSIGNLCTIYDNEHSLFIYHSILKQFIDLIANDSNILSLFSSVKNSKFNWIENITCLPSNSTKGEISLLVKNIIVPNLSGPLCEKAGALLLNLKSTELDTPVLIFLIGLLLRLISKNFCLFYLKCLVHIISLDSENALKPFYPQISIVMRKYQANHSFSNYEELKLLILNTNFKDEFCLKKAMQ